MQKMEKVGPCMAKLNERQREFVVALMSQPVVNYTAAAEKAGYQGERESLRKTAHRLAHDPRVLEAIREESGKRLNAAVGMASERLLMIAQDPTHKDQLKAVTAVLNRGGLHEKVEHTHKVEVGEDAKALIHRISVLAGAIGMDPVKVLGRVGVSLPKPAPEDIVEAEYTLLEAPRPAETNPTGDSIVGEPRDGVDDAAALPFQQERDVPRTEGGEDWGFKI